ncbi:hypothetical protein EBU95_13045 [bacterium]|nr:hypothetical protein [bacterium]
MNPWVQFLKDNNCEKKYIKNLSHQWKNHKSQLVTLHIDYVHKIFQDKQNLQLQVQQLHQQLVQLQQQLDYHRLVCDVNETFNDLDM